MGGHQMASGKPAPLSQSKGAGKDIAPLYFTYPAGEADVDVVVYENDSAAAAGLADLVAKVSSLDNIVQDHLQKHPWPCLGHSAAADNLGGQQFKCSCRNS